MKKTRVLQMFVANARGGRTQYVLNLWKHIDKEKVQFDFATLASQLDFAGKLEEEGCKIHYVSCYAEEDREQFTKEIDEIFKERYDVVHVHSSFWRSFIIEERAKLAGIPKIILHAHNFGIGSVASEKEAKELERQHFSRREKITSDMADWFFACSKEAAEWMYGDYVSPQKVRVLRNGIDLQKYKYNENVRKEIRKELDIEDKYVIGNIGRFVYQKNHDFLIEVYSEICKQRDDVLLLLIGNGELQDEIKNKVECLGIRNKVKFLGVRNDVERILQGLDLFVLPSRFDGFPLSLLEAQAAALPCIAGNVPPNASLGERTQIVPLDVEEWVKAIVTECGRKDRNYISEEKLRLHDINVQVKELEEIYCK